MPPYEIRCYHAGCRQPARYKIAAAWSDGVTQELKTYALSCETCLAAQFLRSLEKQASCRLAPGEQLQVPSIYELVRGQRDMQLVRRTDLEATCLASTS
jgi:hypothetical protein